MKQILRTFIVSEPADRLLGHEASGRQTSKQALFCDYIRKHKPHVETVIKERISIECWQRDKAKDLVLRSHYLPDVLDAELGQLAKTLSYNEGRRITKGVIVRICIGIGLGLINPNA